MSFPAGERDQSRLKRTRGAHTLYTMNITHASRFPDLDGLARSLACELEFHWEYDPHTMQRWRPDHGLSGGLSPW